METGNQKGPHTAPIYLNKIMNKKIAILLTAVALSSFGAHAQVRAGVSAGAAGGQVGVGGQAAGAGGQGPGGGNQIKGQNSPGARIKSHKTPRHQSQDSADPEQT